MVGKIRGIAKPCKGNGLKDLRLGIVGENEGDLGSRLKYFNFKKVGLKGAR
jgi:hypothetical protein